MTTPCTSARQTSQTSVGSAVVLRRSPQELCLLCFLVHSELILSSSSASLTELLQKHDIQMPKNSTKAQKVRRILAMDKVKEACAASTIAKLLARMDEADAKKRNKDKDKNDDDLDEALFVRTHSDMFCCGPE